MWHTSGGIIKGGILVIISNAISILLVTECSVIAMLKLQSFNVEPANIICSAVKMTSNKNNWVAESFTIKRKKRLKKQTNFTCFFTADVRISKAETSIHFQIKSSFCEKNNLFFLFTKRVLLQKSLQNKLCFYVHQRFNLYVGVKEWKN